MLDWTESTNVICRVEFTLGLKPTVAIDKDPSHDVLWPPSCLLGSGCLRSMCERTSFSYCIELVICNLVSDKEQLSLNESVNFIALAMLTICIDTRILYFYSMKGMIMVFLLKR